MVHEIDKQSQKIHYIAMTKQATPAPRYDIYGFDSVALARLALVGFVAGVVGWLLYLGIAQFIVEPVFCRDADAFAVCRNGGTVAWVTAQVLVLAASVAVLARLAIYRPLFVVLGVLVALWAAHSWLGVMPWYIGMLWHGALFAAGFAVFGWLARIPNFLIALISALGVAVVARLILMNS